MKTSLFRKIFRITILITLGGSFSIFPSLWAQEKAHPEILLGLNASKINGGYIAGSPGMTPSNENLGWQLGIGIRYRYANYLDLLPQLEFVKKGSKWGKPTLAMTYEGDYIIYELSYLQFTLNHAFHLCGSQKRGIDFLVGAYGAYLLNAGETWVFEYTPEGGLPQGDLTGYLSDWDFGLSFGIRIFSVKGRSSITLRYDHGLKMVNKSAEKRAFYDFEEKSDQRMRAVFLTLGIKLKSF